MTAMPNARGISRTAGGAQSHVDAAEPHLAPMVFLVGPPGSGKSVFGRRVCAELGLRFVDLADDGRTEGALRQLIETRGADVVAVPWAPTRDARWLDLCRRSGETVALWAHPLDMQARSGRSEALFTPVKRLSTRGGFGQQGTGCKEYRHLDRACEHVLLLVGLAEGEAAQELKEVLEELRTQDELSPAEREGLLGWCDNWRADFNADARACEVLVDAMARFMMHMKVQGASPRTVSGVRRDLNAAGVLVMCCDAPRGRAVLDSIDGGPSDYEFRRKISDSPRALARFRSTWEAFATFLRDSGMIDKSDLASS
jgi:hypothetical protein